MVEEILPGEGIRYTASIHAGEKLKDGEVTFRVAVADEMCIRDRPRRITNLAFGCLSRISVNVFFH